MTVRRPQKLVTISATQLFVNQTTQSISEDLLPESVLEHPKNTAGCVGETKS